MARVILAVFVGFVVWSVIWIVAGQVMMTVSPESFDPESRTAGTSGILMLFIAVSVLASLVAGWLAAVLAREAAPRAAVMLAGLLVVVGLVVEVASWDVAPAWYHLVFLALLAPATLVGARLRPRPRT